MPQAETQQFGSIEYHLADVITFPLGLPGFEQETSFLLIAPAKMKPLVFLQSLGRSELCFVTLPLEVVDPNYQLAVSAEDMKILTLGGQTLPAVGPAEDGRIQYLVVVSLTDSRPTANLLAPLVIDQEQRLGVQAIRLDCLYSHQYPVEALVCS